MTTTLSESKPENDIEKYSFVCGILAVKMPLEIAELLTYLLYYIE